jgi:hypothetical protein
LTPRESEKLTNGEMMVPHMQPKSRVDYFVRQDGEFLAKTTFLLVGFYAANLIYPPFTPNLVVSLYIR